MSLRIRRGTDAQRTSATFDLGEIVYATDTNKLYVGDGVNLGGKNILATSAGTGLIWNATTQRLDFNGSGTGIVNVQADASPSLGGNLNLNSRNITGTGNISITGTVTATQFVGVPSPATLTQNLSLNTRTITGTGNINITGTLGVTGLSKDLSLGGYNITGNGNINISGTILASALAVRQVLISGVSGYLVSTVHTGTLGSPTAVTAGDELGGLVIKGYTNGSVSAQAGIISVIADPTAVIAGGNFIKSLIAISASTDTGSEEANALILNSAGVVTSNAFVASKYTQLAVYANDTARTTAIPTPANGMMVFMTSGTTPAVTNKAIVYNGTAWVALH